MYFHHRFINEVLITRKQQEPDFRMKDKPLN